MQAFMQRVVAVVAEMEASGTFVFGGALHDPAAATVLRVDDGDLVMTDGPFVEAKEHIAGFCIINADDLDAALAWAGKVGDAIDHRSRSAHSERRGVSGCERWHRHRRRSGGC